MRPPISPPPCGEGQGWGSFRVACSQTRFAAPPTLNPSPQGGGTRARDPIRHIIRTVRHLYSAFENARCMLAFVPIRATRA